MTLVQSSKVIIAREEGRLGEEVNIAQVKGQMITRGEGLGQGYL